MVMTIALCYYLLGGIRAVPLLLVLYSAITAVVPVYTYLITREFGVSERSARIAGWLVALSPSFVFFAGSLYKEGIILLALSLAVLHGLRLQDRWQARSFVIVLLAIGGLFGLRFYLGFLMSLVVAGSLLMVRHSLIPSGAGVAALVRQGIIATAFIGTVIALGLTESTERRLTETDEGVLVELDKARYWSAATAQSGYLPETDISTPEEAATFFPIGLLYFLTVPLPWQIGNLRQNLVIPETAFWLVLYPLVATGLARGLRVSRPGTLLVIAATGGMCVIYALLSGNIGVAYRMRSQVWLLWAPFAAWGWEVWSQRRRDAKEARTARLRQRRLRAIGAR
jgi:hypothetical protein